MSQSPVSLPQLPPRRRMGQTSRTDRWWLQPVAVFLGLTAFIVYSTWAALQGNNYFFAGGGAQYLSPFYSPLLFEAPGQADSGHAWFGAWPAWWPAFIPATPALLILWAPGGFRFTCYYYRGAYYKAFWADPMNCAVGEPRDCYRGEHKMPLIFQNIHRYFMYLAVAFIGLLSYDAWCAMWFDNGDGTRSFGVGVGTIVLTMNVILLGGYTFGCHSFRHVIGGFKDRLTKAPLGKKAYDCSSCLNRRHMLFAWMSLCWVGFTDVYVRLCAAGVWSDIRIF